MLEKGYLGGGNTARNTTIIRSNYLTPEGVKFYDASLALWAGLSAEFDFNLFYSTRGHFTLAHSDADLRTARWRAEVNKHFGVRSEVVDAAFVKKLVPQIDLDCGGHSPILGRAVSRAGRDRAPRRGRLGIRARRRPSRRRNSPEHRGSGD